MYREPFLMKFFLFSIRSRPKAGSLELTKNYHQKLITPNEFLYQKDFSFYILVIRHLFWINQPITDNF